MKSRYERVLDTPKGTEIEDLASNFMQVVERDGDILEVENVVKVEGALYLRMKDGDPDACIPSRGGIDPDQYEFAGDSLSEIRDESDLPDWMTQHERARCLDVLNSLGPDEN